jgi:ribose-phosphate pyrophosphokinase
MAQVFPGAAASALEAMPLFADLLRNDRASADAVIVGPDTESETIVRSLAEPLGLEWLVARKERAGDREIRMTIDGSERLAGRAVFLTDDVVSTGTTLAKAAALARAAGAARVEALVVHALLAQGAEQNLEAAGIARLRSSDSILHPSNAVELAPLLAPALRELWGHL